MPTNPVQNLEDWGKNLRDLPSKFLGVVDKAIPNNLIPSAKDTPWHDDMVRKANESFKNNAAQNNNTSPKTPTPPKGPKSASPNSFKDGGIVKKTGLALVHEGETIVPKDAAEGTHNGLSKHRVLRHILRGGLHRAIGFKEGDVIPDDKLDEAAGSENPHVAAMAKLLKGER